MRRRGIESSLGVDPFHVQSTTTAPKKYPMGEGVSRSMIQKESALDQKDICFFEHEIKHADYGI